MANPNHRTPQLGFLTPLIMKMARMYLHFSHRVAMIWMLILISQWALSLERAKKTPGLLKGHAFWLAYIEHLKGIPWSMLLIRLPADLRIMSLLGEQGGVWWGNERVSVRITDNCSSRDTNLAQWSKYRLCLSTTPTETRQLSALATVHLAKSVFLIEKLDCGSST